MDPTTQSLGAGQYLTFLVADEEYAIGVLSIKEIVPYTRPTRVPKTASFVRGVINLRGSVVPVLDLSVTLGLLEKAASHHTCIIILEIPLGGDRVLWGIVADSVHQVVDLPAEQIEAPPAFGTRGGAKSLLGVGKLGDKLLPILDVNQLVTGAELCAVAQVQADAPLEPAAPQRETRLQIDGKPA